MADPSIVAQTWRNSLSLSLGTGKHIPKTISLESEGQQRAVFIIISYPRFVQARRSRLYKPSCQRCTWTRSFACTRLLRNINISEHLNISKLPKVHLGKRLQQHKNVAQKSFKPCNGKLLGCRDTYDERFYLNPALVTDAKRRREKSLQSMLTVSCPGNFSVCYTSNATLAE